MLKKDWLKGFEKFFSSKGTDSMKMEIMPFRDWQFVVGIFFAGLAVSLGFNIYMSIEINRDTFFTTAPAASEGAVFNKEGLAKVLSVLAEKEAIFEKTKKEGVPVVDPSI